MCPLNCYSVTNSQKSSKSLEQRVAEYAEARMRIFGPSSSISDDVKDAESNSNEVKNYPLLNSGRYILVYISLA